MWYTGERTSEIIGLIGLPCGVLFYHICIWVCSLKLLLLV